MTSTNRLITIIGLFDLVNLSACASVPLTGIYKLRNFKPITTNIDELRFAVRVPDGIEIQQNGARLLPGSEHPERANLQEAFFLKSVDDQFARVDLARADNPVKTFQYRVAIDDIERFEQLRKGISIEKEKGAQGAMEVAVDVCRTRPTIPARVPISTFVQTNETKGYVPLTKNRDALRRPTDKTPQQLIPPCTAR